LCTSVKAELWAVVTGLELAWPVVLRRLILEMDSDNFFPLVELEAEHRKK
jgi:ribonuclease HI